MCAYLFSRRVSKGACAIVIVALTLGGLINSTNMAIAASPEDPQHVIFEEELPSGMFAAGAMLTPSTASQSGMSNTNIIYNLIVKNTGSVSDSYQIDISNNKYFATIPSPALIGPLSPGASRTVQVTVQIDRQGATDIATVTATSQTDSSKVAISTLTTTVPCNQGPVNPPTIVYRNLERDVSDWGVYCDGEGVAAWKLKGVATPSLDGDALQLSLSGGASYSNAHFYRNLLSEPPATLFTMDISFYIDATMTCDNQHVANDAVQAIEFTMNKWQANKRYEFALQWMNIGADTSQWRYWNFTDSPTPTGEWVAISPPVEQCLLGGQWHTLTMRGEIANDQVYYWDFTIDGQTHNLDITVQHATTQDVQDKLAIGIQLDGNIRQDSYDLFVDQVNLTLNTYIVSGNVGVADAVIVYTGGSTTSDANGFYSFTVPYKWSGMVAPSKAGYGFWPINKRYSHVTENRVNQNYTINPIQSYDLNSTALNDGWTLESKELSNVGGARSNTGSLLVGDNALKRQYRSILYFDTSDLPDKAEINKATLLIKQESVTGTPFATLGGLIADIKKGYFGLAPLELGDFNATGVPIRSASGFVATGSAYQLEISSSYFKYINLIGATQFRLRFTRDDDNDKFADFVSFYAGNAVAPLTDPNQPQLIIEYYVP